MTTRKRMHSSPKNYYCDAHFHSSGSGSLEVPGILNGTSPRDWAEVLRLAGNRPGIRPAIGLHPWQLDDAPHDWQGQFQAALTSGARAVGEIGLDKRFAKAPFDAQCEAFAWQLKQAAARNLPVSIHCFKATDPLLRLLHQNPIPTRGVHLHAYSGSAEEVAAFVELGAYFSFHAGQLSPPARKAPAALRRIPPDRLLIESDAPDTLPESINQREYLKLGYEQAADLCDIPLAQLIETVMTNYQRYFLND